MCVYLALFYSSVDIVPESPTGPETSTGGGLSPWQQPAKDDTCKPTMVLGYNIIPGIHTGFYFRGGNFNSGCMLSYIFTCKNHS